MLPRRHADEACCCEASPAMPGAIWPGCARCPMPYRNACRSILLAMCLSRKRRRIRNKASPSASSPRPQRRSTPPIHPAKAIDHGSPTKSYLPALRPAQRLRRRQAGTSRCRLLVRARQNRSRRAGLSPRSPAPPSLHLRAMRANAAATMSARRLAVQCNHRRHVESRRWRDGCAHPRTISL